MTLLQDLVIKLDHLTKYKILVEFYKVKELAYLKPPILSNQQNYNLESLIQLSSPMQPNDLQLHCQRSQL